MIVAMKMPKNVREFFRRQGRIGAKKRAANLSPERRKEIARRAAEVRWANRETDESPKKGIK